MPWIGPKVWTDQDGLLKERKSGLIVVGRKKEAGGWFSLFSPWGGGSFFFSSLPLRVMMQMGETSHAEKEGK